MTYLPLVENSLLLTIGHWGQTRYYAKYIRLLVTPLHRLR